MKKKTNQTKQKQIKGIILFMKQSDKCNHIWPIIEKGLTKMNHNELDAIFMAALMTNK